MNCQVNLVTKELFKVAPDPLSMSKMSQEELQKIIRYEWTQRHLYASIERFRVGVSDRGTLRICVCAGSTWHIGSVCCVG